MRSSIFSLMSFLSDIFKPKFSPTKIGSYLVTNFGDYVSYMRTSYTRQDPFKWGGCLEILAASIIYRRPVHVHVMDIKPEHIICFDESLLSNEPLLLSYEGGNHYNALLSFDHRFLQGRPGGEELLSLSAAMLRKVRMGKVMKAWTLTNNDLDAALENKKKMLTNQRDNQL